MKLLSFSIFLVIDAIVSCFWRGYVLQYILGVFLLNIGIDFFISLKVCCLGLAGIQYCTRQLIENGESKVDWANRMGQILNYEYLYPLIVMTGVYLINRYM